MDVVRARIGLPTGTVLHWMTAVSLALLAIVVLARFYPIGVDWRGTYGQTSVLDPYQTEGFISPPWTMLLLPHALLPLALSNAVNWLLNVSVLLLVIRKLGGDWKTIGLVFTSPVFFDLARTNNIEWLPLLGLLVGPQFGGALLACKPQCLAGAFLVWMKRDWRVVLIPIAVLILSFVLWGWWPARLGYNPINRPFNFSVLPLGIPYGIYLLRRAWKEDDPYLAAVATPLLVPYIAPYSLVGVLAVLASRWPKAGYWMYFGLWAYAIVEFRRLYLCR